MSKRNLQRALRIERNLTDSMKELLDTGVITKILSADTIAYGKIIKDLIETNIRQRGDVGGSAKKVGLRIKELERLYGIHQGNGSNQYEQKPNNSVIAKPQEQLAKEMGMSVDTLQNYKMLVDMIPELEELLDTGIATPTTAIVIIKISLIKQCQALC